MRDLTSSARTFGLFTLCLAAMATVLGARAACAGDITYQVNNRVAAGSVVGQIVTDGNTGVLKQSDLVSWNLQLNAPGATFNLTSAGRQSGVLLVGSDLTATTRTLSFNYSGTDTGYLAFQASNPGFYSGQHYYCSNTTWFGCSVGASVVPNSYNDSFAQYDATWTGLRVIAGASGPLITDAEINQSVQALAKARTAQLLVNQLLSQVLVGLNEQVSCSNCGGGGATFGSAALSGHGRYSLSPEWTLLGGVDIGEYAQKGANVDLNVGFATAFQYDPAGFGKSRPYAVVGLSGSFQNVRYHRSYAYIGAAGETAATAAGSTQAYDISTDVQVGWVDRLTRRDEAAAYLTYSRAWQITRSYVEQIGNSDPFGAAMPGGTDTVDTFGANTQYTHLFGPVIEVDVNGGVEWAFNSHSGLKAQVAGSEVAGSQPAFVYYEVGTRVGVRLQKRLTLDMFVNGVLAPKDIGSSAHGGFGLRWAF